MMPSTAAEILLADARAILLRRLEVLGDRSPAVRAFAAYLLPECDHIEALSQLVSSVNEGLEVTGYQQIAVLGFASEMEPFGSRELWGLPGSLTRLAGRRPTVDGNLMPFCTDAVALLGIALAAKTSGDTATTEAVARWMGQFIDDSHRMSRIDDWERCLFAVAGSQLGIGADLAVPNATAVADVRVALRSRGLLDSPDRDSNEADEKAVLDLVRSGKAEEVDPVRAAIQLAAMNWIRREAPVLLPGRATTDDVCKLLRRVEGGLRNWTWEDKPRTSRADAQARRWHVENEYHVQNLLWFLLSPIFPDLKAEENLPSVGQKQPRVDLLIPSLRVIIEVKFVYPKTSFQKIIGEIAEDAGLYLADQSEYTDLVAFVWDDTCRTEEHDCLVSGLKKINGITDAIVVSRPGRMLRDRQES